jgi:hypothetical protein
VAAERTRLLDPVVPPAGWSYLLAFGPGDIYRHVVADGRPELRRAGQAPAPYLRGDRPTPTGGDTISPVRSDRHRRIR